MGVQTRIVKCEVVVSVPLREGKAQTLSIAIDSETDGTGTGQRNKQMAKPEPLQYDLFILLHADFPVFCNSSAYCAPRSTTVDIIARAH